MAEESQNALLKTLEEPPAYAHLILITSEPGGAARDGPQPLPGGQLRGRCRRRRSSAGSPPSCPGARAGASSRALAALGGGDLGRARVLGSPTGPAAARRSPRAARARRSRGELAAAPLGRPARARRRARQGRGGARSPRPPASAPTSSARAATPTGSAARAARRAKRAERRARTEAIDLGARRWSRPGSPTSSRSPRARPSWPATPTAPRQLAADARGADPVAARRAAELAMETRRRLQVNVNEELALDALFHRAARLLGERGAGALKRTVRMSAEVPGPPHDQAAGARPSCRSPPIARRSSRPQARRVVRRAPLARADVRRRSGSSPARPSTSFVSGSSESAAENRAADLASGRTVRLAERVEASLPDAAADPRQRARTRSCRSRGRATTSGPGSTTRRRARQGRPRSSRRGSSPASTSATCPAPAQAVQAALGDDETVIDTDLPGRAARSSPCRSSALRQAGRAALGLGAARGGASRRSTRCAASGSPRSSSR